MTINFLVVLHISLSPRTLSLSSSSPSLYRYRSLSLSSNDKISSSFNIYLYKTHGMNQWLKHGTERKSERRTIENEKNHHTEWELKKMLEKQSEWETKRENNVFICFCLSSCVSAVIFLVCVSFAFISLFFFYHSVNFSLLSFIRYLPHNSR